MPYTDDESEYERQEDIAAMREMLARQLEILEQSPELASKMVNLQHRVLQDALQQGDSYGHVCWVCRQKRHFVMMVQAFTTILALQTGQAFYVGALACALRTPATRLTNVFPGEAAKDLVAWYADEALPEDQRTVPQPAWYSKEQMEWDGHE